MNRDDWKAILGAAIFAAVLTLASAAFASEPRLPDGVTCSLVRSKVAEHGKYVAWAWAKLYGYSRAEIEEAKKCLAR